ncbi:hypothetical protein JK635_08255 [Neobacillus sp. YIM B02564]|uniref:DUF5673 domain-containing protein n=1 Tax=Neobacillus paridis TaxID=2803862 RepID=A0ABS1TQL7_9BACI|nr:hypothetical protein [Neobacillus paridis]MBL4952200.1 hypothetical protein [Neobacillus paridis]
MNGLFWEYAAIFVRSLLYVGILFLCKYFLQKKGKSEVIMRPLVLKGILLMGLSLFLNIAETRYFGWNETAMSTEEMVWDIVTTIPYVLSMAMVFFGFFPENLFWLTKTEYNILLENKEVRISAIRFKNFFVPEYDGLYLAFFNKVENRFTSKLVVETKEKDNREKLIHLFQQKYPELLAIPGIQALLKGEKKSGNE